MLAFHFVSHYNVEDANPSKAKDELTLRTLSERSELSGSAYRVVKGGARAFSGCILAAYVRAHPLPLVNPSKAKDELSKRRSE